MILLNCLNQCLSSTNVRSKDFVVTKKLILEPNHGKREISNLGINDYNKCEIDVIKSSQYFICFISFK